MKPGMSFATFFGFIFISFLFLWMALVVFPWMELGHLAPIRDEAGTDIIPWE